MRAPIEKGGAALLYRSRSGRFVDDAEYVGHPMARAQDLNIDGSMWECPDFYPLSRGINGTFRVACAVCAVRCVR